MSASVLISHEELQRATGLKQTAALKRHLKRANIPFDEINGRLVVLQEAWLAKKMGRAKNKKGPNFEALAKKRSS